jgi:hypothetical protein
MCGKYPGGMSWTKGGQNVGTYGKRPRAGRDMSSDTETKEVEKRNAQGDDDARPQNGRIVNHLVPATGEVKEGRTRSPCCQKGHEENNGGPPKETFEAYSIEGGDGVLFHDLFFDDELGSSTNDGP